MGNHQLHAGSRALLGGVLAGVAPSLGGPLLMVPALALHLAWPRPCSLPWPCPDP